MFASQPILKLAEFFDVFESYLESRNIDCLFAIDEYEELNMHISARAGLDASQSLSTQLLLELRNVLQHKKRIMFLMSGTHYLRELSTVDWSSIFINVRTLHVSFLNRRDGALLLTQPVPEMSFPDERLIEEILDVTGCQPLLLQAMGSELVNRLNFVGSREVTTDVVRDAIDEVLAKQNTYFSYLWEVECDAGEKKKALRRLLDNNGHMQQSKFSKEDKNIRDLARREIVRLVGDEIVLTMPLFAMWVRRNENLL